MGSVPPIRTFAAGELETAAYLNSLSQALTFAQNPPRATAYQSSAGTTLTSGTNAVLACDSSAQDTDGMHSTSGNTSRLTANTPGMYHVTAQCDFGNTSSAGGRQLSIYKNANAIAFASAPAMSAALVLTVSVDVYLNGSGDYVEMWGLQTSGANLTTVTGASLTFIQARWVAIS